MQNKYIRRIIVRDRYYAYKKNKKIFGTFFFNKDGVVYLHSLKEAMTR